MWSRRNRNNRLFTQNANYSVAPCSITDGLRHKTTLCRRLDCLQVLACGLLSQLRLKSISLHHRDSPDRASSPLETFPRAIHYRRATDNYSECPLRHGRTRLEHVFVQSDPRVKDRNKQSAYQQRWLQEEHLVLALRYCR